MNTNKITIQHDGIEVEYDEQNNVWRFTLRGRERSAGSLAKAKGVIMAPSPKDKKSFKPIKCWVKDYSMGWLEGEVTSIAEGDGYSTEKVWVSGRFAMNDRRRIEASLVYVANDANKKLVEESKDMDAEINRLHLLRKAKEGQMEAIKIEAEVEA